MGSDGRSACSACTPMGPVPGAASWALGLDALAFEAGLLDCTLQFPQDSCFSR